MKFHFHHISHMLGRLWHWNGKKMPCSKSPHNSVSMQVWWENALDRYIRVCVQHSAASAFLWDDVKRTRVSKRHLAVYLYLWDDVKRTCETFDCLSLSLKWCETYMWDIWLFIPIFEMISNVFVRHLTVYPYLWNRYMWDIWMFIPIFEMISKVLVRHLTVYPYILGDVKRTCETFGSYIYLWNNVKRTCEPFSSFASLLDDVKHPWNLAVYFYFWDAVERTYVWAIWLIIPIFEMMSNVLVWNLAVYPYLWDDVKHTCETFGCLSLSCRWWQTYLRDICLFIPIFEVMWSVLVRHFAVNICLWNDVKWTCKTFGSLWSLSLRRYLTYMWDILLFIPIFWDDVKRSSETFGCLSLSLRWCQTYTLDIWLFNPYLGDSVKHTYDTFDHVSSLLDDVKHHYNLDDV